VINNRQMVGRPSRYIFIVFVTIYSKHCVVQANTGVTAAAAPWPFRPGNPALCGSRPLVTPY